MLRHDLAVLDGRGEASVVELVLVGVGLRELDDRPVERRRRRPGRRRSRCGRRCGRGLAPASSRTAGRRRPSRSGSCCSTRPTPSSRAAGVRRSRGPAPSIPASTCTQPRKMSLAACISRCPVDDPLAVVGNSLGGEELLEHRRPRASFICRNSGSSLVAAEHQRDPGAGPDAAHAHDLAGEVGQLELLQQHPAVVLQGAPVGAQQLVQPLEPLVGSGPGASTPTGTISGDSSTISIAAVDAFGQLGERRHAVAGAGLGERSSRCA